MSAQAVRDKVMSRCLKEGHKLFGLRYYILFKEEWLRAYPNPDATTLYNLDYNIKRRTHE